MKNVKNMSKSELLAFIATLQGENKNLVKQVEDCEKTIKTLKFKLGDMQIFLNGTNIVVTTYGECFLNFEETDRELDESNLTPTQKKHCNQLIEICYSNLPEGQRAELRKSKRFSNVEGSYNRKKQQVNETFAKI
jgi:hypothetical protein|tara:strand:- start:291 stop:695 length:405 start_codon:yes stop_codon:yes gene_type:complete